MQDGEPWWVAKDVCNVLGLTNSRMALEALDEDEKGVSKVYTLGGEQDMNIISESGLYALIMRSNKPEAKRFRKWVTGEVLPTLRKTGHYVFNLLSGHGRLITTHGGFLRCFFAVTSKL